MIHLVGNFYLDADDSQYMLKEWDGTVDTDKKGNKTKRIGRTWYCMTIAGAFNALAELLRRRKIGGAKGMSTIADLKEWIDGINVQMQEMISGFDNNIEF